MGAFFPDDFIDQIRERTDLVELIGQYVPLKKRGQNWIGLCPFHSERTPSFTVNPSRGIFKCFGCGKGGNVFVFLMEHQQLSFPQAVELLAARLGLALPSVKPAQKEDRTREKLFYANQFAKEYYHRQLVSESAGRKALEYLRGRGLDMELIERFELGWAPAGWESFKRAALEHGIEEEVLIESGLLSRSEDGLSSYDRFRARVMFPIHESQGRTVGFGGRVLDDSEPKYLNSPETPLFNKGEILFGLDKARGAIARKGRALVVEGYMDLLSLWQHGFEEVVAPLGTALTGEQARLLARFAREVFLLYDSDSAGLKASFRGGDQLLGTGVNVRVVTLPEEMDPDDFVRQHGGRAFEVKLKESVDFLDRKMELLKQRLNLEIVSEREKAAVKLLETVACCRDELTRSLYLKKSAEFIGVPQSVLQERLSRITSQQAARLGRLQSTERAAKAAGGKKEERYLLALCLKYREYIEKTIEELGEKPFSDPHYTAIFEVLVKANQDGVRNLVEALYTSLPDSVYSVIGQLQQEDKNIEPPDQVFNACWRQLKIDRIDIQIRDNFNKFKGKDDPVLNRLQESLYNQKLKLQRDLLAYQKLYMR